MVELVEVTCEQLFLAVVCPIPLQNLWVVGPFLAWLPCWVTLFCLVLVVRLNTVGLPLLRVILSLDDMIEH